MSRKKLARLIWKLWRRRNYYKYWYFYEREDNNAWNNHFAQRQADYEATDRYKERFPDKD